MIRKPKKVIQIRNKVPTDCFKCKHCQPVEYGLIFCPRIGMPTPQPNCLDNKIECFYFNKD